jgi:uncharacterized membrane protein
VLAVRYDAYFTAILGLLGGFATPLALSTDVDRPVGLFSYILLLNVGLLAVALKKRWHGLVLLALGGTFFIEVSWFGRFMAPEKMLVGLVAFLVFGLLYLLLPVLSRDGQDSQLLLKAGALGGTVPFLFAVLLAGNRQYSAEWPLLFGYVGLLSAACMAVALFRGRVPLLIGGALATAVTLPLWASQGLSHDALWGPVLGGIALGVLFNLPTRLAARIAPEVLESSSDLLEAAGLVGLLGPGLFAFVLVARGFGEPPWAFMTLVSALLGLLMERTRERRVPGTTVAGGFALAILVQFWFFRQPAAETLLRNLGVGLLLTVALSLLAAGRSRAPVNADEDEAAVVAANAVFLAGLFGCLGSVERGGDPWPLFAALAVTIVLLVASALRRDWMPLLPVGLCASALYAVIWQESYFHPTDLLVVVPAYATFFLAFLALPFLVPASVQSVWRKRSLPWLTSALAGPAFFLPLYRAVVSVWGKAWIGVLPVLMAAATVAALSGVGRLFTAPADAKASRLRLRYLALFAATGLGFVALAIALQFDRQWITIGLALEAAAVWWLFTRLPHPGLRTLGAVFFASIGARLLLNPEVLRYEERGLPIVNWLLYTYGVPVLTCFVGAALLKRANDRTRLGPAAAFLGLLLGFWLINLEVMDFFSTGPYMEFTMERRLDCDLTMSVAWGLYAMALLVTGLVRRSRELRMTSLGFLLLTVAKVFLYDLANLTGLYRVLSFLGLGVSLILVSLLYQRFVAGREAAA